MTINSSRNRKGFAMNDHNLMGEVVAKAERGRDEYTRMQEDMASLQTRHDQLELENKLLRQSKEDVEARIISLQEERDFYMRFTVEMSAQLTMLDQLQSAHSTAMTMALKKAIEAARLIAQAKPQQTKETMKAVKEQHVVTVNEAVDRIKDMAAERTETRGDDALASVAAALGQASESAGAIADPAPPYIATRVKVTRR